MQEAIGKVLKQMNMRHDIFLIQSTREMRTQKCYVFLYTSLYVHLILCKSLPLQKMFDTHF